MPRARSSLILALSCSLLACASVPRAHGPGAAVESIHNPPPAPPLPDEAIEPDTPEPTPPVSDEATEPDTPKSEPKPLQPSEPSAVNER